MSDTSTSPAPAPTADERLAAVEKRLAAIDPQVGRYSGAKDCHIVVSPDNAYLRSM